MVRLLIYFVYVAMVESSRQIYTNCQGLCCSSGSCAELQSHQKVVLLRRFVHFGWISIAVDSFSLYFYWIWLSFVVILFIFMNFIDICKFFIDFIEFYCNVIHFYEFYCYLLKFLLYFYWFDSVLLQFYSFLFILLLFI